MDVSKQCGGCKEYLGSDAFYKDRSKSRQFGLTSYCKRCNRIRTTERNREYKKDAIELFGGKCLDCGGVFHPSAYDFHHLDPTIKEGHIKDFIKLGVEKAKEELEKCVLLCANCHRIRHATGNI